MGRRRIVLAGEQHGGNALDLRITVEGPGGIQSAGGGPDFFGYRWEDNIDPNGPALEWIDVSGGTDIGLGGDDFVAGIPLGFAFRYYGLEFSTIGVGSNGWLSFTGSSGAYPTSVPQPDFYAGAIAPYARDLLPPSAEYVRYRTVGVAPDRRFVVEYNQIPDVDANNPKTFEVVLYERTHAIRFQYLTAPNAPEGFGIESADESLGLGNGGTGDVFIDPARVGDGYAIEFIAPPTWLHVEPAELDSAQHERRRDGRDKRRPTRRRELRRARFDSEQRPRRTGGDGSGVAVGGRSALAGRCRAARRT